VLRCHTTRKQGPLTGLFCLGLVGLLLGAAAVHGEPRHGGSERGPGCVTVNSIAFSGTALFRVRHTGNIECTVPTIIVCAARLYDADSGEVVSRQRERHRRDCAYRSPHSTARYPRGHLFRERLKYRITLTRRRDAWLNPPDFCPWISDNRKVLICRQAHRTRAPITGTVEHGWQQLPPAGGS
jgi:hypothetical protein